MKLEKYFRFCAKSDYIQQNCISKKEKGYQDNQTTSLVLLRGSLFLL